MQVSWDVQTTDLVGYDITVVLSNPPNDTFDLFLARPQHDWVSFRV